MRQQNCKIMVDVTKPPYNCDNTGKEDCTEALCSAFDDILKRNIEGVDRAVEKLNAVDDPNYRISFEIRKTNNVLNVIFPEFLDPARILYFPKGTYLVSDTVSHRLPNLKNILNGNRTMEINRQIYIMGEERDKTVIKLKDNCKGYEFGNQKPIISYIRTEQTNIAMTNSISNITIDCGKGNEGAVGVVFCSSNSGAVRNVNIISSDEERQGYCGLSIGPSEAYVKDVTVIGFDYGIKITDTTAPVVCENINISNQNVTGFLVNNATVPVYNIKSVNKVTPFRSIGFKAFVTVINGEFIGGSSLKSAVVINAGEAYLRNIKTEGYRWPLIIGSQCNHFDNYIKEVSTSDRCYNLFDNDKLSLNLDVECAPDEYVPRCENDIAYVDDFGAIGDGVSDSTQSIQAAMNSGKSFVCFGEGHYVVGKTIDIPKTVKTVDFVYCDFFPTNELKQSENTGMFKIFEDSVSHLTMKRVFAWEQCSGKFRFVEHAAKRNLVLRDLHTQCCGMYFNTVGGSKVFVENCACTMGGGEYCKIIPFEFKSQRVWCRNINPERGDVQILNDNSLLWILGMKTESFYDQIASTAVKTINGGSTEIFGVNSGLGGKGVPLYINNESDFSGYFMCGGSGKDNFWDILVEDTQNGITKQLKFDDAWRLGWYSCRVPGYVSTRNK